MSTRRRDRGVPWILALVCACGDPPAPAPAPELGPGPAASPAISVVPVPHAGDRFALPERLPALAAIGPQAVDPDGLPILTASGVDDTVEGHVRWLVPEVQLVLQRPRVIASDGARIFYAGGVAADDSPRDLLIRDGAVHHDVVRQLGGARETPVCAAASAGHLVVASLAASDVHAWHIAPTGEIHRFDLDLEIDLGVCSAFVDARGRFAIALDGKASWNGETLTHIPPTGKDALFSELGTPSACAPGCSPYEARPETAAFADAIRRALDGDAQVRLFDRWMLGVTSTRERRSLIRAAVDGPCCEFERIGDLPRHPDRGTAMTARGDVVIALDGSDRTYRVWPAGAAEPGPPRSLALDARIAWTTPTLLLRGLPPPVSRVGERRGHFGEYPPVLVPPPASVEWPRTVTGDPPTKLRIARERFGARARPVAIFGAAVDLECSGVIWFTSHYFGAPRDREVVRPRRCLPLETVVGIESRTELLLARTRRGRLAVTWDSPALDLDDDVLWDVVGDKRSAPPRPPPAPGWIVLGAIDGLAGPPAISDPLAEPSRGPEEASAWQRVGAATVRVGDRVLVIHGDGVLTIPADATPLALHEPARALAARGSKLLICDAGCVEVDPGVEGRLTAAFRNPALPGTVVVHYEDGRIGFLDPAGAPQRDLGDHPVAVALREVFARRRAQQSEYRGRHEAWLAR